MNYLTTVTGNRIRVLISAFVLLLSSFSIFAEQDSSVPVEVVTAHYSEYAKAVRISGLLENKSEQSLGFKISGLVSRVYVDEGQFVKKGQLLAVLDLEEIDAEVSKAKSVLANAERNLKRFQSLQGKNALSMDQVQSSQTRVDVASSDLTVAQFNRRHAVIKAPEAGRILNRALEPNELVQAGQTVFVFAPKKSGWVLRTGIIDKDIVRTQLGDKAELYFDAYPNQQFQATVSEVAGRADPKTQTFEIELRLENTAKGKNKKNLLAGFVGHGRVYPRQKESLALLPLTALLRANGKHAEVYILDEHDQAHLRLIEVAFIEGSRMAVRAGIQEGDRIVIQGAPYLSEGRSVAVQ
ncbi:MAG: efflux transporter periplasmic adaptor subunit [Blastopirellula sp.]|nr:MAG: efflux transporter periplasmic adaptor subunit [Blastopirellula sp.]